MIQGGRQSQASAFNHLYAMHDMLSTHSILSQIREHNLPQVVSLSS